MKEIKLNVREAEMISRVLNNGMPYGEKDRDFLAEIDYKLSNFVEEAKAGTV